MFKKQLPSLMPIERHDIVKYLYNANYSCRRVPKLWLAQYLELRMEGREESLVSLIHPFNCAKTFINLEAKKKVS